MPLLMFLEQSSRVMWNGVEQLIALASRTLLMRESNYVQLKKEALALIFVVRKFHIYLYGCPFTLVTDNKPLQYILGPKKGIPLMAAARLQRWLLYWHPTNMIMSLN